MFILIWLGRKSTCPGALRGHGLPGNPWCRWGRSWGRRRPGTTPTPCWRYELRSPEKSAGQTRVTSQRSHTGVLTSGDTPTLSPGVQCSLWVTSMPTRVLYMTSEETNTEQRSRVTASAGSRKQAPLRHRILLMMLHRVHTPMASRARYTDLLWKWGCMWSDSRVWTRM